MRSMNAPGSPSSPLQMTYLVSPGCLRDHAPFLAGGKSRAAATAQAGLLDGGDDLLRLKRSAGFQPAASGSKPVLDAGIDAAAGIRLGSRRYGRFGACATNSGPHSQAPRQRRKAIVGQVFIQVQRVEPPIVLHGDVDLPVEERAASGVVLAHGQALDLLAPRRRLPPAGRPAPASRAATRGCTRPRGRKCAAPGRRPGPAVSPA